MSGASHVADGRTSWPSGRADAVSDGDRAVRRDPNAGSRGNAGSVGSTPPTLERMLLGEACSEGGSGPSTRLGSGACLRQSSGTGKRPATVISRPSPLWTPAGSAPATSCRSSLHLENAPRSRTGNMTAGSRPRPGSAVRNHLAPIRLFRAGPCPRKPSSGGSRYDIVGF
jgi:hypothetical protein